MSRTAPFLCILAVLVTGFAAHAGDDVPANFVSPRVIYAGGIAYPDKSAGGLVELWVNLDKFGYVTSLRTVRDIPSLTAAVSNSVTGWMFSPGFLNGNAVASNILVCVAFNPGTLPAKEITLTSPQWSWQSGHPAFAPPDVSAGWYAPYSQNSDGGTVVVDASLNSAGAITRSAAVYTTPNLTAAAIAAAAHWKFEPAKFQGAPIASHAVIAFVLRRPPLGSIVPALPAADQHASLTPNLAAYPARQL